METGGLFGDLCLSFNVNHAVIQRCEPLMTPQSMGSSRWSFGGRVCTFVLQCSCGHSSFQWKSVEKFMLISVNKIHLLVLAAPSYHFENWLVQVC